MRAMLTVDPETDPSDLRTVCQLLLQSPRVKQASWMIERLEHTDKCVAALFVSYEESDCDQKG